MKNDVVVAKSMYNNTIINTYSLLQHVKNYLKAILWISNTATGIFRCSITLTVTVSLVLVDTFTSNSSSFPLSLHFFHSLYTSKHLCFPVQPVSKDTSSHSNNLYLCSKDESGLVHPLMQVPHIVWVMPSTVMS